MSPKYFCSILFLVMFVSTLSYGQIADGDTSRPRSEVNVFKISLEEILNKPIVLASQKSEKIIRAPLSATVITREEIIQAGSTSIPEALRLAPGVIVREVSNGNYDIHIRGLDNVPPSGNDPAFSTNTVTLVMINNRPVYNYFQGGTFWETLPVDIADVERIEIVRGPASALYGTNAVQGVINIITSSAVVPTQPTSVRGNVQYGNHNSIIGSLRVEQQVKKLTLGFSMNHHNQNRGYTKYYSYSRNDYIVRDSLKFLSGTAASRYPDTLSAIDRNGANMYVNYNFSAKSAVRILTGWQRSQSQKIYADGQTTPLTTNFSDSKYIQLNADIHNLYTQVAYNEGTQNAVGVSGWEYDFNTLDAQTEYSFERKHLVIRPGISYRLAEYDDEKSIRRVGIRSALIDGRKQINSYAAYLRSEFDKGIFRLVGAVRGEKYNIPDKLYFSYQFALTCSPRERYMIRLVHSRANRSSFILDSYYNQAFTYGPLSATLQGNTNLTLMQLDLYEIGFRTYLGKAVLFDLELFLNKAKNYAKLQSVVTGDPSNTLSMFLNLPTKADQYGGTVSIDLVPSSFFKIKTYATYQQTYVMDHLLTSGVTENYLHRGSPDWYGGLVASVKFHKNLNLNLNPYFFSGYRIRTSKNTGHLWVQDCILINAKLDYRLAERTFIFITARNLLSNNNPQVTWADPIGMKVLGGLSLEF